MLLSINLPGMELSTIRGEIPQQQGLPAESTLPVGGFAELLGLRSPDDTPPLATHPAPSNERDTGDSLPTDGKDLPQPDLLAADRGVELSPEITAFGSAIPVLPAPDPAATRSNTESVANNVKGLPTIQAAFTRSGTLPSVNIAPRDPLPISPASPAAPVNDLPAELRNLAVVSERPYRAEARPVPTSTDASDLDTLMRGIDPETGARQMTRSSVGADINHRQHAARDGLSPKPAIDILSSLTASIDPEAAASSLSGVTSTVDAAPRQTTMPMVIDNVAAGQPAALSQPAASQPAPAAHPSRIDLALQDPAWGDALNERVTFMAGKDIRSAEIRLNPAELGPIRVHLSVDDRGTSVSFTAHHAQTRDAIEQALPRLRELFGEQGLSLGQASVSDQGVRHDRNGHAADGMEWLATDIDPDEAETVPVTSARTADGLVDTFA